MEGSFLVNAWSLDAVSGIQEACLTRVLKLPTAMAADFNSLMSFSAQIVPVGRGRDVGMSMMQTLNT